MTLALSATMGCSHGGDQGLAWRDDDRRWRAARPRGADRLIDWRAVIGSIGDDPADVSSRTGHEAADHRGVGGVVIDQFTGGDLVVVGIDREMKLAPPMVHFAMLGRSLIA